MTFTMLAPAQAIIDFVERQSAMIRPMICWNIVWGFTNLLDDLKDLEEFNEDPLEMARSMVDGDDLFAFQRCIHVIGALDFAFAADHAMWERFSEALPVEYDAFPQLAVIKAQAGLTRRFQEKAAEDWRELRQGQLSYPNLHVTMASLSFAR